MAETTLCNWAPSLVTEQIHKDYVDQGLLAAQEVIGWRVIRGESVSNPAEGEAIVFTGHILKGFTPPGSKFFRDVLHYFSLHPQDIGPN